MRELPEGWEQVQLLAITNLITKGTTPTSVGFNFENQGTRFIKIENIKDGRVNTASIQNFISDECHLALSRSQIKPNDILFSIAGTIGKTAIVNETDCPANTNQAISIIRPECGLLEPRFLKYQLESEITLAMRDKARGGAMNNISLGDIGKQPVVLPPLNEQKRIADRLDQLLTRIDRTKAHLDRIPPLLKRFRQSVLAAATSGRLTEDWRETNITSENDDEIDKVLSSKTLSNFHFELPEIPEIWIWKTAIQCCEQVVDCHNKTAPYTAQGIKLIRTSNIRNGKIDLENTRFIDQKTYEFWSRRCPPKPGDLIFTREAPMAEVGMIPDNEIICMGQRMMLLRCDNLNLLGNYLLIVLQTSYIGAYSDEVAVGTGVKHLRVRDVENLPIPIPPIEEQQEIVRRVEALFAKADRIEAQYQKARQQVDRLTPALLAKAFRGELVPQDPKDEPASVLLERVREGRFSFREASPTGDRPAKKGRIKKEKISKL